ncbi:methylated-DNA--[protein]-cysteine S-methyltransferase [Provencibacterium massiliense]|uniref:methylated-DNA--[protein]-cysteine S-methyltransferase n=1 Tax=Provencibacterium massiliense TaxID=1841868 RepID=UPI0009A7798A|nr:methylated-DNA--[protein]-cysteine S-methyltransferase [Provencibacterium massiliense]RGB69001.1 methylated-DNA--[protein]-cysteine S-methyltransferase [Harryflintia acetispora]
MQKAWTYQTELGELTLAENGEALTRLSFGGGLPQGAAREETPLLQKAHGQLTEYLAGERRRFELPLAPGGTPFEQAVWAQLLKIPYGETCTYGGIAARLGRPGASRAVGMANHRNPIGIIIPCHRVIGKDGSLTGYAGGLGIKERLLILEGALPQRLTV